MPNFSPNSIIIGASTDANARIKHPDIRHS